MTNNVGKLIRALWQARESHFPVVWMGITLAAVFVTAWAIKRGPTSLSPENGGPAGAGGKPSQKHPAWVESTFLLGLLAFLAAYLTLLLKWEHFTYYDQSMFTLHTMVGKNIRPPIWPAQGRFFPLGHQEFNFIRHFTHSVAGYYAFPLFEVAILVFILLVLDRELSLPARALLASFALVVPAIFTSFGHLIFTERNLLLWTGILALSVRYFEETHFLRWAVLAVISAQIIVYYKEPAFLLILGFGITRLSLRRFTAFQTRRSWSWLGTVENRLDFVLLSVAFVFLIYYATIVFNHPNLNYVYADEVRHSLGQTVYLYAQVDALVWLLLIVLVVRVCLILSNRTAPSLLWDGLASGGAAYFLAYVALRIFGAYYLAPADLVAVLYVGRFAVLFWKKMQVWGKVLAITALSALLLIEISFSACCLFEEKNVVYEKAEIADVIAARYRTDSGGTRRIFFPFASSVLIMQFSAYLSSLGIPVKGSPTGAAQASNVDIESATARRDGPCVDYEPIFCYSRKTPEPGDLVVVLPDDEATLREVAPYRADGNLLVLYQPYPRISERGTWLVHHLRLVLPHSLDAPVPDRWLDASISVCCRPANSD